jgi:anti-sigma factor ChrR (cupin superfamily)
MHYHVESEDNLILAGGYTTGTQHVLTGDWVVGVPGTRHSPRTDPDEECWCLSLVKVGGSKLETFHGTFQGWLEAWEARRERLP